MKTVKLQRKAFLFRLCSLCAVLLLSLVCIFAANSQWMGGMSELTAVADTTDDWIAVRKYDVEMTVQTNRKVKVKERITVEFLEYGLTMFYRSLPKEGCLYEDIQATCAGNNDFSYYVADNPDLDGFIDVNCVGDAQKGKTWTYDITYTMQQSVESGNGMMIDVIGFGWSVPLYDINVTMHFPSKVSDYTIYVGGYGSEVTGNQVTRTLSEDGKTLVLEAPILKLVYNDVYDETMAEGITLAFEFSEEGVLAGYADTRIFTEDMGWLLGVSGIAIGIAFVILFLTKRKRDIITVVNIKAPDDMDPMQMGKILDGTVDNEDITSMIYYFANKGYLKIDLTNEDDPKLISLVPKLPATVPAHERTLFDGLFKKAKTQGNPAAVFEEYTFTPRVISVSELVASFYESAQAAKLQVPSPKPMYELKSILGYIFGAVLGVIAMFTCGFFMGAKLGGEYVYTAGASVGLPVLINLLLGWVSENYRYKWKKGLWRFMRSITWFISGLFVLVFIGLCADHVMTGWEKAVVCLGGILPCLITQGALSRTEKYVKTLGDVLGFKEFILVTEEERISFMLQENPELYYKILPYAQVLGVTNEWEKKFEKITLQPPTWYIGPHMTVFDYLLINRCMRTSMTRAFAEAARRASGGGHIGRSGGGGGFGGFGGGGFGGGGGGAR